MIFSSRFFALRPTHWLLVGTALLAAFSCSAAPSTTRSSNSVASNPVASNSAASNTANPIASLPVAASPVLAPLLANEGGAVCAPDESVISQGGGYSANVELTASVALPGKSGVDVVMTAFGAIAAVNTDNGSTLYWIDPANGDTRLTKALTAPISDLAFDGDETIAVATGNKVIKLSAATSDEVSEISLAGAKRVAISSDGHVAAIAGKTIHLYDSNNRELLSKLRDYTDVTDIELLSCENNSLIYVTSFRNATFTDLNNKRNPVQIARLEAINFAGEVQWSLFSDSPETIKQNVADTRLYRVTRGRDGFLYIGGESAGTATIFRWRGLPMTEDEQYGKANPFLTRTDVNTQLHNSGSAHIPYYARVHPTQGNLVTSQMTFPRLSSTKSNTMRIGDVAASEKGTLYFGGAAGGTIPNRENLTLNGVPVGAYEKRDRAWLSVSPNFRDRNFWTVLADEGGQGIVQGVDAGYGYSAALTNAESGTVPVTTGEQNSSVFLSFTAD